MRDTCDMQYHREPPPYQHLIAVCTRPKGHDGEHSNVLHKPGADPDRAHKEAPDAEH